MALVVGTQNAEKLYGYGGTNLALGNDQIYGLGGNDEISSFWGTDFIDGGEGDDIIDAGTGNDVVLGGLGNDIIRETTLNSQHNGNDTIDGGAGTDTLDYIDARGGIYVDLNAGFVHSVTSTANSLTGEDRILNIENIITSDFDDIVIGNGVNNTIITNSGNDNINAGAGDDYIDGGFGDDIIMADLGNDTIVDAQGSDRVNAGAGNDTINAGAHADTATTIGSMNILIGNGNDIYDGSTGIDTINYAQAIAGIAVELGSVGRATSLSSLPNQNAGIGNDILIGIENVEGTQYGDRIVGSDQDNVLSTGAGNDFVDGRWGNDTINAEAGNDTVYAGDGNDTVIDTDNSGTDRYDGQGGFDTIKYVNTVGSVTIDLERGFADTVLNGSTVVRDEVLFFENATTSSSNDTLRGNAGNNVLDGGAGNDLLEGRAGNDNLVGGAGNDLLVGGVGADVLTGGSGVDVFKFTAVTDSGLTLDVRDTINDFTLGDKIDLSAIDAKSGTLLNDAFKFLGNNANVTTANANGALWYTNGVLYGSTDGDTAAEFSVAIKLVGMTGLSATDFVL